MCGILGQLSYGELWFYLASYVKAAELSYGVSRSGTVRQPRYGKLMLGTERLVPAAKVRQRMDGCVDTRSGSRGMERLDMVWFGAVWQLW